MKSQSFPRELQHFIIDLKNLPGQAENQAGEEDTLISYSQRGESLNLVHFEFTQFNLNS
jgi:hypothetical protein